MTTTLTFADVRNTAMSGEGECCVSQGDVERIMLDELRLLWSQLTDDERRTNQIFDTIKDEASYQLAVPGTQAFALQLGPCYLERQEPECEPCSTPIVAPVSGTPRTYHVDRMTGKIVLAPVPSSVQRIVYSYVGDAPCNLWAEDTPGVRTWLNIPLPLRYQGIYTNMVRGRVLAESDPARSASIYNAAVEAFNAIQGDARSTRMKSFAFPKYASHMMRSSVSKGGQILPVPYRP